MSRNLHTDTLPGGYVLRRSKMEDAAAVVDVRNASNTFDFGSGSTSEEVLRSEWQRPDFDREGGTWIVEDANGEIVAYAEADLSGRTDKVWAQVWVLPEHRGCGIEERLVGLANLRVVEQVAEHAQGVGDSRGAAGAAGATITIFGRAGSTNEALQLAYKRHGFELYLSFQIMQLDLEEEPKESHWPTGIEVRSYVAGKDEQATYLADEESAVDKGYHTRLSFEEWSKRMGLHSEHFDPAIWFLAWHGDEVAGVCLNVYIQGHDDGWVDHLGVRRNWRKRGLGSALLRHSFRELYRRGATTIKLSVDSASLTNAPSLYSSAGMRIVQLYHIYKKVPRGV